jgi:hypothetical protein
MTKDYRSWIGISLVLIGVLLGLQQFGILAGGFEDAFFALAFGAGVVVFAIIFFQDRRLWWAALVAFILAGLTSQFVLDLLFPTVSDGWGGPIFLAFLATGFLIVFLLNRTFWWAIIPSGVLYSVALTAAVDEVPLNIGIDSAGVMFIGMGVTFLVLYFMPIAGDRQTWAIYPAIPLLVLGAVTGFGNDGLWDIIWPSMLIVGGLYYLFGAFRSKK